MNRFEECLQGVHTVAIAGHVNPDGDCIGSCMGLHLYLRDNYPEITSTVYLESFRDVFSYIEEIDQAKAICAEEAPDLLILVDISSRERIGVAGSLMETAGSVICFDHHVTNRETYSWSCIRPEISSTCEVIYGFLDPEKISPACAAALYTGIAHDTGIFQYSSTSPETMRIAASLMEKGIPFSQIIDISYYQKTYGQNRILGRVLQGSRLELGGRLVLGTAEYADMQEFSVEPKDMDGIVSELRNTIGAEVAVFIYEKAPGVCKVSLRSRQSADVAAVAQQFGGGGHVRAAGCTIEGTPEEAAAKILEAFAGVL